MTNQLSLQRIYGDPAIDGETPIQLRFSPDGKLVTYLKSAAENFEQLNLWAYDTTTNQAALLVDAATLVQNRVLSDAEKARRERQRITHSGIVEYHWSPTSEALLFPLEGNLYLYTPGDETSLKQLTGSDTFETDIKFSPDGNYLSFVRDQNLFVIELSTGTETQLTTDGGGNISNGLAEFIAQEEMHRFEGYWWSPDSQQIAFTRVDESPVLLSQRYEIDADNFGVFDQRYPFTGTSNARVDLGVVSLNDGNTSWPDLARDPESYICRINWFKDSQHLAVQIQSRNQQLLELHKLHLPTNTSQVLITEQSDTWINLNNNFTALKDNAFIWGSERSGYNHLYLYDETGKLLHTITGGDWVVSDVKAVDASTDELKIYFSANKDTVLESQLYVADLATPGHYQRITEAGYHHTVSISQDRKYFIDRCSSALTPPAVLLRSISGELVEPLVSNELNQDHPFAPFKDNRGTVTFGELTAEDGQALHYRLIEPCNRNPGQTYPVIITVYGGPGVQRVTNEWIPAWHHYMAQRGYGLLQLDNRGSTNRGKAFEAPIYKQLGVAEVSDQLVGLQFLKQLDWVDENRIGVFGHSYGGYMTLMLMMKSDSFKAGVSVAPVTDWGLYDTHYTERYLSHPEDNPHGYKASNVFPYAKDLSGKLLIIHGMADDNVLFTNSTKLYKVLQDENIQFDIMNYPGAKHGLAGRKTNLHRYSLMDRFFDNNL